MRSKFFYVVTSLLGVFLLFGACIPSGLGAGQAHIEGHRVAYAFSKHQLAWVAVTDVSGDFRVVSGAGYDGRGKWARVQVTTADRDLVLEQQGRTLQIDLSDFSLAKGGLFFVAVDADESRPYVQVRQLDVALPELPEEATGLTDTLRAFLETDEVQRFLERSAKDLGSDFTW